MSEATVIALVVASETQKERVLHMLSLVPQEHAGVLRSLVVGESLIGFQFAGIVWTANTDLIDPEWTATLRSKLDEVFCEVYT